MNLASCAHSPAAGVLGIYGDLLGKAPETACPVLDGLCGCTYMIIWGFGNGQYSPKQVFPFASMIFLDLINFQLILEGTISNLEQGVQSFETI